MGLQCVKNFNVASVYFPPLQGVNINTSSAEKRAEGVNEFVVCVCVCNGRVQVRGDAAEPILVSAVKEQKKNQQKKKL